MRPLPFDRITVCGPSLLVVAFAMLSCGGAETKWLDAVGMSDASDPSAALCNGTTAAPPPALGVSSFYTQYMDANGIPVVASPKAKTAAVAAACSIVVHMLSKRDDVRQAMMAAGIQVTVLAQSEKLTDIPEYRDLYTQFPGPDWNALRGVSATETLPVASAGEENLLCLAGDPKVGESELVFTFGISMEIGIERVDSGFGRRIDAAFDSAMSEGLWANTYSTMGRAEYWGEAMQAWFSAYKTTSPADGVHNDVGTRTKLEAYDPTLAMLVGTYAPDDSWTPACPMAP